MIINIGKMQFIRNLSDYLNDPENARNIIKRKRFIEKTDNIFETTYIGRILTQIMQNDEYI